jgi:hypothetical protein
MEPSFRIAQVETLMTSYTDAVKRSGMRDLAIWQSLDMYYSDPSGYDLVATSTKEEAFDRIVKDNWMVDGIGDNFYGIDYEWCDEKVLQYLIDNHLMTRTNDEDVA